MQLNRLACTYPDRRFAGILTNDCARLGADGARYTFIAADLPGQGHTTRVIGNETRISITIPFADQDH